MDVVHDQLTSGRKFRVLTLIDKWNRQCIALHVEFALTGQSIVEALPSSARTWTAAGHKWHRDDWQQSTWRAAARLLDRNCWIRSTSNSSCAKAGTNWS